MTAPTPGGGSGTTVVLGIKIVKGLALTGIAWGKVVWLAVFGLVTLLAGVLTLGRHRRIAGGEQFD